MARKSLEHFTDGEIEIMQVIWQQPEGLGTKDVFKIISKPRKVAWTTIASMMQIMEDTRSDACTRSVTKSC